MATPPASAQGSGASAAAEALYREGQRLMEAGKVHDACIKFAESRKIEPTLGTLINLANCHEKEGKTASAWAEFTEATASAARAGQRDRERFAREHAESLEKQLRTLVIDIPHGVAGTEVEFDGQRLGGGIIGTPIPVDPGDHEIYVSAPKKKAWTKKVSLGPGPGSSRIDVPRLEDAAQEPAATTATTAVFPKDDPSATASDQPKSGNPKRTIGYIVGGAGVVALGTGIVFLFRAKALSDQSDREASRARDYAANGDAANAQVQYDASVRDHDSAASSQTIGIISGAAGVAAVGAGIFLIVTAKDKPATAPSARVTPLLSPSTAGASATFTF